ncbi:MAG: DNA-binding protein [Deltaproteobacteria bacterium]|nr:DNA-binding protein [Deltaproteobacteria bacterium]
MTVIESIGSQNIERVVQFRIKQGADLLGAIEEAVQVENIRSGVIVSGLGALRKAIFRNLKWFPDTFPPTPKDRLYLEVEQPMELVSLVGWIAPKKDGGVEIHAHFSASTVENDRIVTLGGHLTKGTICAIKTVVSILVITDNSIYASHDDATQSVDIFF